MHRFLSEFSKLFQAGFENLSFLQPINLHYTFCHMWEIPGIIRKFIDKIVCVRSKTQSIP